MNSKQISGLAVVSIAGGHKLGSIGDVFVDAEVRKVLGYTVTGGGGRLSSEPTTEKWLPVESVNAIGPDALTVREDDVVQASPPPGDALHLSDVLKRKVVTEGGTLVGQISSLELDAKGATVANVEVSSGLFKSNKMVAPTQMVSVGEELIIVRDSVLAEETAPTPEGEASSGHRFLSGDVEAKPSEPAGVKRVEAELVETLPSTAGAPPDDKPTGS